MLLSNETKKRYDAFWAGETFERCVLYLTTLKEDAPPPPAAKDARQKWTDLEYRTRLILHNARSRNYYADAFPMAHNNFGPGSLAACIGGTYLPADSTVWFENEQVITDWNDTDHIVFNENSEMFKMENELVDRLLPYKDELMISVTDIGGAFDIIASLRGTQQLLMDLYEYPEQIKKFTEKLQYIWK